MPKKITDPRRMKLPEWVRPNKIKITHAADFNTRYFVIEAHFSPENCDCAIRILLPYDAFTWDLFAWQNQDSGYYSRPGITNSSVPQISWSEAWKRFADLFVTAYNVPSLEVKVEYLLFDDELIPEALALEAPKDVIYL